jgi:hypothetical protein
MRFLFFSFKIEKDRRISGATAETNTVWVEVGAESAKDRTRHASWPKKKMEAVAPSQAKS